MKKIHANKDKILNRVKNAFKWNNIKSIIFGKSTGRRMFRLYFLLILIFACILYMPISFQPYIDYGWSDRFQYVNGEYVLTPDVISEVTGEAIAGEPVHFSFTHALFLSFSSFSDTGLTTIDLYNNFSIFGKLILMLEIQVGGFGVMFFIFMFWKIFKRTDKISINQQLMAQSEKGNTKIGNTQKMLIQTVIVILIIEFIFGLFYSLWFMYVPAYEQRAPVGVDTHGFRIMVDNTDVYSHLYKHSGFAFFAGFFHSITAINNAGFDIIGNCSLTAYSRGIHTVFLYVTILEFVIGGIGFPVIFDFLAKFKLNKTYELKKTKDGQKKVKVMRITFDHNYKISLFSKVALSGYAIVTVLGVAFFFLFEGTGIGGVQYLWKDDWGVFGTPGESLTDYNKVANIFFQAMSTRSAGYYTFDNRTISTIGKWLNIALMFVGGSPSSTAGGIRVTTFMVIFTVTWHKIKGSNYPSIFKKRITTEDTINSFIVLLTSLILLAVGGAILYSNVMSVNKATIPGGAIRTDFTNSMFMVASAFGTTGLGVVDLYKLKWYSLVYLMLLMFIGQCGVSSTVLAFRRNKVKENMFRYVTESIKIG